MRTQCWAEYWAAIPTCSKDIPPRLSQVRPVTFDANHTCVDLMPGNLGDRMEQENILNIHHVKLILSDWDPN